MAKNRASWSKRDVISILDFSREELELLFEEKDKFVTQEKAPNTLSEKIVATAFFEPSTRTRLSFSVAALRLGAKVIDLSPDVSSLLKGESFADTISMLEGYADLIVLRHPSEGAALFAAELCEKPVINGGDGSQHHPTQAMLDIYTVSRTLGQIDGLVYAVVGDLKYSRTASSLLYALTKFKPKMVHLVSPEALALRKEVYQRLKEVSLPMEVHSSIEEVISQVDVIYLTRIQKERFADPDEYKRLKGSYVITKSLLEKSHAIVLHPLPRLEELPYEVDRTPNAAYIKQAHWGVPLRMALLNLILGDSQ